MVFALGVLGFGREIYMEDGNNTHNVQDARGIWVASGDSAVVEEIKEIVPNFLPNVESSTIDWVSGGVQGEPKAGKTTTTTESAVSR